MEIVFIRHGETVGNAENRYSGGGTDEPLSSAGLCMAEDCGARFAPAPARVYVSPMRRAKETAKALFPDAVQVPVAGLSEMHFGAFEGKTADELANDPAYRAWVDTDCETGCPGGEDIAGFSRRVLTAFSALVREAAAREETRLVVVTHGGVIMAIMTKCASPAKESFYSWHVGNCCGYAATLAGMDVGLPRLTDCRTLGPA